MNLAFALRPRTLDEFFGQTHLVGQGKIINRLITGGQLFSMILWGPPGSGKTTLAKIIVQSLKTEFFELSGVTAGKEELLKVIALAKENQKQGKSTILFIDEIHRWNKSQQDALLPYVENGLLTLIGATTENPSFEVISPLLSRSRVFVLGGLAARDLERIIDQALSDKERGLGKLNKKINQAGKELIVRLSGGDARIVLNALEMAATAYDEKVITEGIIQEIFQTKSAGLYDKKADEHYNVISAYIKSVRGSDPDAALYYLARMLASGEDPKFIARRMIILASEDIGLADRGALIQANACFEAASKIGMPEAQLTLAHGTLYLATAKKSRGVANALEKAKEAVVQFPSEPIPLFLRNAPTKLMKNLGYGKEYRWGEDYVGPTVKRSFLPDRIKDKKFYEEASK